MKFPPVLSGINRIETSLSDHAQEHAIANIDNGASEEVVTSTCFNHSTLIYESVHSIQFNPRFTCCHGSDMYSNDFARQGDPHSGQEIEDVGLNNNNNIM